MTAYVVFIKDGVNDQAEMAQYNAKAGASTAGHPLAFYGPTETWEGPVAEGLVIIEFPDMAAARAWYTSPAYEAAKVHRLKGATYRVMVTEGLG